MSTKPPYKLKKQRLDEWLRGVDYRFLNSGSYIPSDFAILFMNFIKLVNGKTGESHTTPPVHLAMLDKMIGGHDYIVNLCFRGAGKTAVFMEYLTLFIAWWGSLPGFGDIDGMIYVSDSMDNGVKSARKNIQFRYDNSAFLKEWITYAAFTDNYLEFQHKDGHRLGCKMFGAKTGLRGTKIFGKRPVLAVLDDLVSDDDSKSKAAMIAIKDTVYKGVNHALDPTRRKVVFNGTPFNSDDILIEAVESGGWDVNVWPVCEHFPCTREEFSGAWPERFSYDYIQAQYDMAVATGKTAAFYQELMLQITSEDDRLVADTEIQWYSRTQLLANKGAFNFYTTTDFAVSSKANADWSVISDWAYNANGDWFWVDGECEKQDLSKSLAQLFDHVQRYAPLSVGIEVTGQQMGFISIIREMMMDKNIWFNFASNQKSGDPGIRPTTDKLLRFNTVVPWFKARKMFFPEELKKSRIMGIFMEQLRLATKQGFKGKDDCIDTISQLQDMNPWKPSGAQSTGAVESELWDDDDRRQEPTPLSSYVV